MTIDALNEKSMEMIVKAGAGRTAINRAMNALLEDNKEEYEALMEEAKQSLKEAHEAQTDVLTETITDPAFAPNILFTHAQDTMMTIMSEMNTAKHIARAYWKLQEKING